MFLFQVRVNTKGSIVVRALKNSRAHEKFNGTYNSGTGSASSIPGTRPLRKSDLIPRSEPAPNSPTKAGLVAFLGSFFS